jgi:hypothetical protein
MLPLRNFQPASEWDRSMNLGLPDHLDRVRFFARACAARKNEHNSDSDNHPSPRANAADDRLEKTE